MQILDAGSGHCATSKHPVPSGHRTTSGHRGVQESVGDDIHGSELLGTTRTNSRQVYFFIMYLYYCIWMPARTSLSQLPASPRHVFIFEYHSYF